MINAKTNKYNPDYAIHPGEYLAEVLKAREIRQRDLSERMGISETQLSNIVNTKKPVGPETAIKLERVLGISANIWNNLNARYRLFHARKTEKKILSQNHDWVKGFPLSFLRKMRVIPESNNYELLAGYLLEFFGVSSPTVWEDYFNIEESPVFRQSPSFRNNAKAAAAWLRVGEVKAESINVNSFSRTRFNNVLDEIRSITRTALAKFIPRMEFLCGEAGVALVFVPEPKGVHVYGATKWLNSKKAMIAQTLRHKSDGQFWFTFFHEAGHILLHTNHTTIVDDTKTDRESPLEKEADEFARNVLVPNKEYIAFVRRNKFYESEIKQFARMQNLAPGIIVGYLQHDKYIPFSYHNKLKRKFKLLSL